MTADDMGRKMGAQGFASGMSQGSNSLEDSSIKDGMLEDLLQRAAEFLNGQQPLPSESN